MRVIWAFMFVIVLQLCSAARILVYSPMPSRSHSLIFERLVNELGKRGHKITFMCPFKPLEPNENVTEIILPNLYKDMTKRIIKPSEKESTMFAARKMSPWLMLHSMASMGAHLTELMLNDQAMIDFIKSDQKFDLIMSECVLNEAVVAGFSQKFNAPIVLISPFIPNYWANQAVGNPAPSSYVPESILGFSAHMTFCERVINFIFTVAEEFVFNLMQLPGQDALMRKHFGNHLPPLEEIIRNTSIVLVNHHHSLAFPRPYLPNMIEIGGYHVNPPKPLPKDLQKYIDDSKDGVILFSMGSHLKSADMPKEKRDVFLNAFARLKQNILWKFEEDNLENVPKNVKISKWLPQSDILAHPNVKLFITHGGLLSTTESFLRGKPMIGIPIMGDQPTNMKYVENAELGISLDIDRITEDSLYNAITEVLNNPKYTENVKKGSMILQDTPLSAIDTGIFWIEYVIRHKGAPHLRSAAQDLKWYELYLLDVIGFLIVISFTLVLISFHVTRFILKRILGLFTKNTETSSKKKRE